MIVVDTSVWIDAFRRGGSPTANRLRELLDADLVALVPPIRVELLSGASKADRPRLGRTLAALPLLPMLDGAWERIEGWVATAGDAGERFGVADLLIAEITTAHGAVIWSLDDDFRRMARLGFVKIEEPVG